MIFRAKFSTNLDTGHHIGQFELEEKVMAEHVLGQEWQNCRVLVDTIVDENERTDIFTSHCITSLKHLK